MEVVADVELLPHQLAFVQSTAQYPALVGGFGSGKTESAIFRMLDHVTKYGPRFRAEGRQYVYGMYEPTFDLIKLILFPRIEELLSLYGIPYKLNKTDKVLLLGDLATVVFRSMENPDRIIGYEHADCGLDELDTLPEEKARDVWEKIIGRNRLNKGPGELNTAGITTTPEGYRFVYNRWERAPTEERDRFVIIRARTEDNIFLPKDYVDDLRSQYPASLIEAYLNGIFVNLKNQVVYTNYHRDESSTDMTLLPGDHQIYVGLDFNVTKMSAVIAKTSADRRELHVVEEIAGAMDTPDMIAKLKARYPGRKLVIFPDAAGAQRKTIDASKSDIALLRQAGFTVIVGSKNPYVRDRVLSVQALLKNMHGERRLFISEECPELIDCILKQTYTDKGEPDKSSGHDHMLDALGYLVWSIAPVRRVVSKADVKKPYSKSKKRRR